MAFAEGITATGVSDETVRATLARCGVRWRRAKGWITSPDPAYAKKSPPRPPDRPGSRASGWAVGFADETWWSRLAHPAVHTWTDRDPLRMIEQSRLKDDPEPKALACYGLLVRPGEAAQRRCGCASWRGGRSAR